MATTVRFQVRGDTAGALSASNPKLLDREIVYDKTNRRLKVGDGNKQWNDLAFLPPDVINDLTTGGSENALSAEQGKVLKGLIDDVASKGITVRDDFTHAESDTALSAGRGKVLYETKAEKTALTTLQTTLTNLINQRATTTQLTNLQTTLTNLINQKADKTELTTLQTTLTTQINNSKVSVVNNLTSTSASSALSAYQGKVLNDSKLATSKVSEESWTFTLEDGSTVTKKVCLWV